MYRLANQRVVLLIDAENLEIQARNSYGGVVDYRKILQIIGPENILRALYFKPTAKLPKYQERELIELGFEVKSTMKNCDTWLTVSAVTLADKCDAAVLFAGDSDFFPLLWFLSSRGVKTLVWSWPECTSSELRALADEYWPMSEEFLLKKSNNVVPLRNNSKRKTK